MVVPGLWLLVVRQAQSRAGSKTYLFKSTRIQKTCWTFRQNTKRISTWITVKFQQKPEQIFKELKQSYSQKYQGLISCLSVLPHHQCVTVVKSMKLIIVFYAHSVTRNWETYRRPQTGLTSLWTWPRTVTMWDHTSQHQPINKSISQILFVEPIFTNHNLSPWA